MSTQSNAEMLTRELVEYAHSQGVDLVGCTSPEPLDVGNADLASDPKEVMPDVRTVVAAACYTYGAEAYTRSRPGSPRGRLGPWTRVSPIAYEHILRVLAAFFESRGYHVAPGHDINVKTAAVRAGIASYGRNSIVHAEGFGSYLELAAVLTDAELVCTARSARTSDCPEECRACINACPTGALAQHYRVRRDRCICAYMWGRSHSARG
jgi:epoxyqueuosine reductase